MSVLAFLCALLALIVAVVGLLLQNIPLWDGIGLALAAASVLVLTVSAVMPVAARN